MPQQYLFYILLAVAFVALIVLPGRQRKKMATQAQQLQASLKPGARVMTTAGIHGTVIGLGESTVILDIAPGVPVTFERRAILQVVQPTVADVTGTEDTGGRQADYPAPGDDTGEGNGTAGPAR
jgi:preprotein translocase subunit YajC